jgi:hypothetical protein
MTSVETARRKSLGWIAVLCGVEALSVQQWMVGVISRCAVYAACRDSWSG